MRVLQADMNLVRSQSLLSTHNGPLGLALKRVGFPDLSSDSERNGCFSH